MYDVKITKFVSCYILSTHKRETRKLFKKQLRNYMFIVEFIERALSQRSRRQQQQFKTT